MMRWILQLAWEPTLADAEADAALASLPGHAGRHLSGSVGGGLATWDVSADDDPRPLLQGTGLTTVDVVALTPRAGAITETRAPLVKRTLLLEVRADVSEERRHQFEADLVAMPRHIPSIRSWALSTIDVERTASRWTHAWEQEYASVDGLRGEYMTSPYHWSCVDRWFDPEMPSCIVQRDVAHVFYESLGPVLVAGTA